MKAKHTDAKAFTKIAINLKDKGYSMREIQRILGYKSVRSVQYLLREHDTSRWPSRYGQSDLDKAYEKGLRDGRKGITK